MKDNMDKNSSDIEKFTSTHLTGSLQAESFSANNIAQRNKELQQEQTRYVNRVLEAYGDCV